MSLLPSFYGTPRLTDQHPDIFPGDPEALRAVFVEVMRARFQVPGLPYLWKEDPTPGPDEENTDDSPRTLYVDAAYEEHPKARNTRPGLYVDIGDTAFQQIVIGNRGAYDIPTGRGEFIVHGTTPITIMAISNDRGESSSLGMHTAFTILSEKNELRETFGFHAISEPTRSKTDVYRASANDDEEWLTTVAFQVVCKYLWYSTPIAPKIREIRFKLAANNWKTESVLYDGRKKK